LDRLTTTPVSSAARYDDTMTLEEALRDYNDYSGDVANSGSENFDNNLRRFVSLFDLSEPLGTMADKLLPPVAFDEWYAKCQTTSSMVGSDELDWPLPRREKVALQLQLLRRIASRTIVLYRFCAQFCSAGANLDDNIRKFVGQIFRPFCRDFLRTLEAAMPRPSAPNPPAAAEPNLIDEDRLDEIRGLPRDRLDFRRLVRLCEELNNSYRQGNYHSVALLTRAILDHVPPVFACRTFAEVANNYGGSRSFREAMESLQNTARKIGDLHLHTPIRGSEVLPTATQVNFSNTLDLLLGEIVRTSREAAKEE
jgi:hypothetical protein